MIGCGSFARNQLHARRAIAGVQILALCDRDAGRLAETAARFGIARTYANADALPVDGGLDVVDVAPTVAAHRPLVEAAAATSLHAICQKPFAERAVIRARGDSSFHSLCHAIWMPVPSR
ncbi:hypothetical protein E4L95_05420 [Paracoccus liaowanqingii]|uniref:Gfo/Idh/MocA-like oxidoreductase N-terminal domain-containing protein n=1 Tax=Paracoccus liaowanqingii TaxID=2560053 RepID=A0A4Z1CQE9_9RHOB|nr:Gfo/Idh/MocA family oxidoreductase [Paracoccus liaowanqingii]TGN67293.1 hypothetical protein E4L95_05420 [Paracoccus liaowanqingii]